MTSTQRLRPRPSSKKSCGRRGVFFLVYLIGYSTFQFLRRRHGRFLSSTAAGARRATATARSRLPRARASILVPAHNEGVTIVSSVRSCSDYSPFEVVVVDIFTDDTSQRRSRPSTRTPSTAPSSPPGALPRGGGRLFWTIRARVHHARAQGQRRQGGCAWATWASTRRGSRTSSASTLTCPAA